MKTKHDNILKILIQKLKYLNYSNRTIECYSHYVEKFLIKINKYHQHLVASDFQKYLDSYNFTSISQQNQIINAIKFFYERVLNKKYGKINFKRPRKNKTLPKVIDKDYLINKINAIKNTKHMAIITLSYSVGLRVSEVINLKIEDIDSDRMLIFIRNAKGNKDRIVPLSDNTLKLLRKYYIEYKPLTYLFNGQKSIKYTASSCNKIVKNYINKDYHFHMLRHSSFTSMLEGGTDISIIQKIAGHRNPRTTQIYTQISSNLIKSAHLPV